MNADKTLCVTGREEWRAWLEKNFETETAVWLIYYKKHTGKPTISYDAAVEEALCFGWIDSTVRRIDDERYMQRFTPRKDTSNWSEPNKKRIAKLIKEGRMTAAGFAKMSAEVTTGKSEPRPPRQDAEMPDYFARALKANKTARENFNRLAPSYQRQYIGWIKIAKRPETRARRVTEAIELLSLGKKLGIK